MSKPHRKKPNRHRSQSGPALQDHLVALWQKLAAPSQAPAIDRFLARELGRLDGLSRRDRLWLGDLLTDGLRFGALTVFAEAWRRDSWQPADTVSDRLAHHPLPAGDELWHRLRRLPVPVVFFWTFMRKRLTGCELPAIAPPGPLALEVWRTLREQSAGSSSPAVRALWAGLPPALLPQLEARAAASGWPANQLLDFVDRHALRPPIWLRLLQPAAAPTVRAELAAADFTAEQIGAAIKIRGERGVYELPGYRAGRFEIQDRASQAIGEAVDVQPGQLVWDCCAGAGGKTVQLAALMRGQGAVYATDLHASKLTDLQRRAKRAGLDNIQASTWSGESVPRFGAEIAGRGGFDRVLVDAPCSGSGTWRRNVDGRLRFDPSTPNIWAPVQARLLALAATAVRPGGRLVYATCSWLTEENEAVCQTFTNSHPQWTCTRAELHGNPTLDSDTTFVAVLINNSTK